MITTSSAVTPSTPSHGMPLSNYGPYIGLPPFAYYVYSAIWNPRQTDVFASASGECTLRIWDVREPGFHGGGCFGE
ncbi:hypothetical protein KIW84_053762 [Lathyrus oleraceus]|uniref:Peroxin-7 n=1 Tax=Pisum sativum TaxID=3888 RepID=A0A9D5AHA3_PEA|nr:hypothetical protein KIW84_053762 [Pisum sativum]